MGNPFSCQTKIEQSKEPKGKSSLVTISPLKTLKETCHTTHFSHPLPRLKSWARTHW